mgnify:CR=1 FL=1
MEPGEVLGLSSAVLAARLVAEAELAETWVLLEGADVVPEVAAAVDAEPELHGTGV